MFDSVRFQLLLPTAFVIASFATNNALHAQPLEFGVAEINAKTFPEIRLRTFIRVNGDYMDSLANIQYTLTENGVPVAFEAQCPKPYNSIAMVLDYYDIRNGGSLWGTMPDSLPLAVRRFIDTLSKMDEFYITVLNQPPGTNNTIGFTRDTVALHRFLDTLHSRYADRTVHTQAMWEAIDLLRSRGGNKHLITYYSHVTLGVPSTDLVYDSLIKSARKDQVNISAVAYGEPYFPGQTYDRPIELLANRTGGFFISVRHKVDLDSLTRFLIQIAEYISSPYCTLIYTSPNCTDTLKHLELTATVGSQVLHTDTLWIPPHRPDTLHLSVEAEQDQMIPGNDYTVWLPQRPNIATQASLSFRFLLRYDPNALDFRQEEVKGSLMEGALFFADKVSPGVLECEVGYWFPQANSELLMGFKFTVLQSDTTRCLSVALDSVTVANGCPNTVFSYPDTVCICNCQRGLAAEIINAPLATNGEVRIPVVLTDTLLTGKSIFSVYLNYDTDMLEPIGVDGIGAITQNARLDWRIKNGDTLEVRADEKFDPAPGNVLFFVRFKVKHPKSAATSDITIPYIRAYSDCCYHQSALGPNSILIDGLCDKVVRRRADFTLEPNAPNPARGETSFRFTVHEREHFSEVPAVLTLYRSDGSVVGELYNNTVRTGEHVVPYNTSSLPAGTYYYTLTMSGRTQTRSLVVVK